MVDEKRVVVLAGPNGAGKTTSSRVLLPEFLGDAEFVNADVIERQISEPDGGSRAFAAGRMMLERIRSLTERGEDLAFETTLASRTFAPLLRRLTAEGYRVYLFYFWLRDPETSIDRIKNRVRLGGHHVPDDVVRRRYVRGLKSFFELYRPLAHLWRVYDNSGDQPVLVAYGHGSEGETVEAPAIWRRMQQQVQRDAEE